MEKKTLIIDADPGIDDAIALLILAKYKKYFNIKLITSCAGNCSIDVTTKNALYFAKNYFNGVRVARGECIPLVREHPLDASDVHSASGLGNFNAPNVDYPCEENACLSIVDVLKSTRKKVTIVTLGAMTNIAKFIINYPDLKYKIDKIYAMIGSIKGKGNIEPFAEFNAYFDPEALDIVAKSGIPMIVNPMELGVSSIISKSDIMNISSKNATHDMIKDMVGGLRESIGRKDDICLYDPNTIIPLIKPELYDFIPCDIEIYTNSEERGRCVMKKNKQGKHAYLVVKDKDKVKDFVMTTLFY